MGIIEKIKQFFVNLFWGIVDCYAPPEECFVCRSILKKDEVRSVFRYKHASGEDVSFVCEDCTQLMEDNSFESFDL